MLRNQQRKIINSLWPSRIPNEEYGLRREKLVKLLKKEVKTGEKQMVIVMKGAKRSYIAPDVPHAFRQKSHFRYLNGITTPDCYYVIQCGLQESSKPTNLLFANRRTDYETLWEGPLPSETEWEKTANFSELSPTNRLIQTLEKVVDKGTAVFSNTAASDDDFLENFLKTKANSLSSVDHFIERLLVIKSDNEMDSMRDVCNLGAQTMSSMISGAKNVHNENAICGLLEFEGRRRGSEMQAYPPVIAGGVRANTIHYLDANADLSPTETVLVDAGCDLNGYVSDITRCFPISGHWSDAQLSLYEALLYVHEQLLTYAHNMEKVRLSALFRRMNELLAASFSELGLIKSTDPKEMIHLAEKLCPHHVSHYLGMDVHDCATVSRDVDLPANVSFTIEPGCYVPMDWPVKEFRGIGYRIEDDVATSSSGGIELLTAAVPRDPLEIQRLMGTAE
ncbi:hypothetical protein B9Z55_000548 [Caenorhabditis nigoni]|uniref:Aminopeptidase P N-terminal domain-containing protein n=1 Tax=Caenorhabditis nigoni TaxID=1611254 RepID=A0A2G5VTN9_9PELO|nr:hypothetical protein B9Z55_000548 [Caenorhabditis nigoni]